MAEGKRRRPGTCGIACPVVAVLALIRIEISYREWIVEQLIDRRCAIGTVVKSIRAPASSYMIVLIGINPVVVVRLHKNPRWRIRSTGRALGVVVRDSATPKVRCRVKPNDGMVALPITCFCLQKS